LMETLLGYGKGCPPSWCATAAAAETWALATALKLTAFPPQLRADCQSLLTVAEGGTQRALAADKPLARAWAVIAAALDGDVTSLTRSGTLAWLPAHLPIGAIGERRLSNGKRLSALDWRANRLVDALAKQAAGERQAPIAIRRLLASAKAAVKHSAALLGEVTHTANNHRVTATRPDGSLLVKVLRDSLPKQSGASRTVTRARASAAQLPAEETPPHCSAAQLASLTMATQYGRTRLPPNRSARAASEAAKRRQASEEAVTRRRVEEILSASSRAQSSSHPPRPTAAERLSGVFERVRARLAARAVVAGGDRASTQADALAS
jgi:hypothetical protein